MDACAYRLLLASSIFCRFCSSLISCLLLFFPGVPAHAESLPHQLSLAVRVTERLASCLPSVRFDAARFRQLLKHLTRTRITAHFFRLLFRQSSSPSTTNNVMTLRPSQNTQALMGPPGIRRCASPAAPHQG